MKKNKLAVFDIDGTIFRKNLHFELINELVFTGVFHKEVKDELQRLYRHWLDNEGTYEAYRNKLVSLYEENIKGCKKSDIVFASKNVASFHAKRIYIFAKQMIEKMREDHTMLIISGSPAEIVEEYANIFKFDAYYGTMYGLDDNMKYTGKSIFEPTADKGLVVRQFIAEHKLTLDDSFGIGDTESDAKFLELVANPIAFNPNMNLRKIAEKNKWQIVVEKKDVVYEMERRY
jgi:HAD superfamily hydrolase (TIGR01490 family)